MRAATCSLLLAIPCVVLSASHQTTAPAGETMFVNGRVLTMSADQPMTFRDTPIFVSDGKVSRLGPLPRTSKPIQGLREVDLGGRFVVPGFVVAHAHVSDVDGLKPRSYTETNARRQLNVFARYGITSVFSLGGEQAPAFALRDAQSTPALDRARIFVSGAVITGRTPDEARQAVAKMAAQNVDIIKIRVDDNLGSATKMAPEVYRAVIDEAHSRKLRVAAHIFYLDDAKDLLRAGVDMIAHSVRDKPIDDEFIQLMKARNVPYCPTLTREISVFAYEETPRFFDDAFFQKEADKAVVAQLREPARQAAMKASKSAQAYKAGLAVAQANLKRAADAGILIAMGTDSGAAPERFIGYFEHLEMTLMVESGMTPLQVLKASTVDAARALQRQDIGAIEQGRWADLVVLDRNPLTDILNTRSISSVFVAGNPIQR